MVYEWTPVPGSFLLDRVESSAPFSVSATVSAKPTTPPEAGQPPPTPNPVPTGLSVSHDLPDLITVTVTGTTATFSAPTTIGLFPVTIAVETTKFDDSLVERNGWDEVDELDNSIIRMDVTDDPVRIYTINLTALGGVSESVTMYIRITTNYTINANTLTEKVNERRWKPLGS